MTDRPSRFLKISKNTENMNTTNQCNLITIYRTQWPKMAEHALQCTWNISKIDHLLGHEIIKNIQNIEIIQSVCSDHSGVQLEINKVL